MFFSSNFLHILSNFKSQNNIYLQLCRINKSIDTNMKKKDLWKKKIERKKCMTQRWVKGRKRWSVYQTHFITIHDNTQNVYVHTIFSFLDVFVFYSNTLTKLFDPKWRKRNNFFSIWNFLHLYIFNDSKYRVFFLEWKKKTILSFDNNIFSLYVSFL